MFKVGDIITGLTEKQHPITNSLGTYEVVKILNPLLMVQVLTHAKYPEYIGKMYPAYSEKFRLVEPYTPQTAVLRKIAHLRKLFENRKQEYKPYGI